MVRESRTYTVHPEPNNLTNFWTNHGYAIEGENLVKKRTERVERIIEQTTPISDVKTLTARTRTRITLKKAFGSLVYDATHLILTDKNAIIPIKSKEKRVYLKRFNVDEGEEVNVMLVIIEQVTELVDEVIIEDNIPITTLIFSTFVKGEYRNRRTGVIERKIVAEGDKVVIIGIRNPLGISETQFWDRVFSRLKSDVIDEFKERLTLDEEFESIELDDFPDWSILEDRGNFPRNSGGLR